MKKYSIVFIILTFISCTLESQFNLPNTKEIDANLLGSWMYNNDPNDIVIISKKDGITYTILVDDCNQSLAYAYNIKNYNIIAILDGDRYLFYGFELKSDTLKILEIDRKLQKVDFNSQEELLLFFNKNINRPDFFTETVYLTRQQLN